MTDKNALPDYKAEGREVDVKILRALALGARRSVEIQLLLDSQISTKAEYQKLSLVLADISVPDDVARATFERLRAHHERLRDSLGRPVGIKTAAMDYLENIERALNLKDEEQALTYQQLAQMAFYDQLTGLANFRYFTRRFNEEIKRADRYRHLLSLAMLDIDHFKKFTDQHGHPAGNKVLEQLAALLHNEVRETDLVVRYGGEEFAVLLPETTKSEAHELCERIRARVEHESCKLEAGATNVTVSIGMATYPRDAHSPDALLSAADSSLYLSKNNGRNRVTLFTPQSRAVFSYMPDHPDSAQAIAIVGDFHGWDKNTDLMQRQASGQFSLALQLAPGRYAYKFVINNEWYITDPHTREFARDGYGGRNSILVVKE